VHLSAEIYRSLQKEIYRFLKQEICREVHTLCKFLQISTEGIRSLHKSIDFFMQISAERCTLSAEIYRFMQKGICLLHFLQECREVHPFCRNLQIYADGLSA
jgi:hypothetical protein